MKAIFFLCFLLSFDCLAGDGKGNGGDILSCTSVENSNHFKSLDIYEAEKMFGTDFLLPEQQSQNEIIIIEVLLEQLRVLSPKRFIRLNELLHSFYSEVKWVNFSLGDIDDTGDVELPIGCSLLQIVNQNKKILPKNKSYLIRKDLWGAIDIRSKVSLIIHEILYRDYKNKTSTGIRKYNSYLLANEISKMDFRDYLVFIMKNKFTTNSISNVLVDLTKDFTLHSNNQLKFGFAALNSNFTLNGQILKIWNKKISFYENGNPKELCHSGIFKVKTDYGILAPRCFHFFEDETKVTFHSNGILKSAGSTFQEVNGPYYKIFLGSPEPNTKTFSEFHLYSNGAIKEIRNARASARIKNQEWIFSGRKNIQFYKNKNIKSGTLNKPITLKMNSEVFLVSGIVHFDENKNLIKTFTSRNFTMELQNQKIKFSGNSTLEFFSSGVIKSAVLAEDVTLLNVKGKSVLKKAFSMIQFNQEGFVE